MALSVMPARAIINGTQDTGNIFSSTGLVINNGHHWCSGVLYRTDYRATSSTLFMTAGHCALAVSGPFEVTFDSAGVASPSAQYINVVAKYTIPSFAYAAKNSNSPQNGDDVPDVAAVGYGVNDFTNAHNGSSGPRYYKDVNITPGQRTQSGDIYLNTGPPRASGTLVARICAKGPGTRAFSLGVRHAHAEYLPCTSCGLRGRPAPGTAGSGRGVTLRAGAVSDVLEGLPRQARSLPCECLLRVAPARSAGT
jgi:hypothetical protein